MPAVGQARDAGQPALFQQTITAHPGALAVLQEYCGAAWAMEPARLGAFLDSLSRLNIAAVADIKISERPTWRRDGATAVIPVRGVLLKTVPTWMRFWGYEATGYDEITAALGAALADAAVKTIRLDVASPGGMANGNQEVANALRAARAQKRLIAHVDDLSASAAYWLTSQADEVSANPNSLVGSIGVFVVYWDMTKLAQDLGIKVVLIRSGELKGMGVPGAPISDEQIAAMQENIDAIYEDFIAGVAAGRRREVDEVRGWALGRVWEAKAARDLGLIDAVRSANSDTQPEPKEQTMEATQEQTAAAETPTQTSVPTPAAAAPSSATKEQERIAAITAAFQKTDPTFALEAIQNGWDVNEAKAIRHDRLEAAAVLQNDEASQASAHGVPFEDTDDEDSAGGNTFMADARALAAQEKISMTEAMKRTRQADPASFARFREAEANRKLLVHGKH